MLKAGGEAIVPDVAPGNGLSPEQRSKECVIIDTLERPDVVAIGRSQQRMEALATLAILQAGLDTPQTIQAANAIEKMLRHQLAGCIITGCAW